MSTEKKVAVITGASSGIVARILQAILIGHSSF
jgi:NADP-dependent 3-hydroxy acid dehydrogenase YdfG